MVVTYNFKIEGNKRKLVNFLESQKLTFDDIDTCFVIKEEDVIVACACKKDNVFKMIAVSCQYQALDFLAKLVTALIEKCHEQQIYNYFIFTKMIYEQHFMALGFKMLVSYKEIGLFEMGNFSLAQQIAIYKTNIKSNVQSGAIVMNANPFTNGHLYLIEQASQKVEQLIVFIVQQDDSYFDFETRLKLAKQATQHISNVRIVASGPYMISQATFPTYFLKTIADKNEYYINIDIKIFEIIMKALAINIRFVGSEPFDQLTSYYNQQLELHLKEKLCIINRKEYGDVPISASLVRKYYFKNQLEAIKQLVPETTYTYLLGHKPHNVQS